MSEKIFITNLLNAVYYFLENVIIIKKQDRFCLFVRHSRSILINKDYKTLKGAKIAFSRMFKKKAWRDDVKPMWSHFYDPDEKWLNEKTHGNPSLEYTPPPPPSAPAPAVKIGLYLALNR